MNIIKCVLVLLLFFAFNAQAMERDENLMEVINIFTVENPENKMKVVQDLKNETISPKIINFHTDNRPKYLPTTLKNFSLDLSQSHYSFLVSPEAKWIRPGLRLKIEITKVSEEFETWFNETIKTHGKKPKRNGLEIFATSRNYEHFISVNNGRDTDGIRIERRDNIYEVYNNPISEDNAYTPAKLSQFILGFFNKLIS